MATSDMDEKEVLKKKDKIRSREDELQLELSNPISVGLHTFLTLAIPAAAKFGAFQNFLSNALKFFKWTFLYSKIAQINHALWVVFNSALFGQFIVGGQLFLGRYALHDANLDVFI